MPALLEKIATELRAALGSPLVVHERLYWVYLLTAALLAAAVFHSRSGGRRPRALLRWLCSPRVWWHPSARTDYLYFLVNRVVFALLFLPWVLSLSLTQRAWERVLSSEAPALYVDTAPGWHLVLLLTVWVAVAMDLGLFLAHWLQHRVPFLWEFHKVHHSAEVMTPVTVARMHPVDDVLSMVLSGTFAGAAQALFVHCFPGGAEGLRMWGVDALLFCFYVLGYNLRHSHVWLHWPWASSVVVSPAMHQIHHSVDARHWDRNLGFMFSFWDRLAGTLYLPERREKLRFGLGTNGEELEYRGVLRLYFLPLIKALRLRPRRPAPAVVAVAALLLLFVGGGHWLRRTHAGGGGLPSVYLEELTWGELRDGLGRGVTTVIIPTGGTEQNGPHVVLGKHNYIVREAAGQVARLLGDAVVAPVVAYVPEGEHDPPTEHMRFPGTISLPEPAFEALLEAAARSFRAHGFRTVCFLGDSLGNQEAQRRVAERLDAAWAPLVRVLHLGDYYAANGQLEWLAERGFSRAQIGGHAGIRDTSELLAVHPQGVRRARLEPGVFERTGADGDPRLASAELGRALLELKVRAAVAQVRTARRRAADEAEVVAIGSATR